ncbi:MAG: TIGR02996 domain-containing protein [Myxococcales bacterium]|nr:TIGR02996 domain-containing protein [Myxococcales bacterium]
MTEPDDLAAALTAVRDQLAARGLRFGTVSPDDVEALQAVFEQPLPEAVHTWFALFDGVDDASTLTTASFAVFGNWTPISARRSAADRELKGGMRNEICQPWQPWWLALMENGGGDSLVLDLQTGQLLTYWHDWNNRHVEHADLGAWAAAVLAELDELARTAGRDVHFTEPNRDLLAAIHRNPDDLGAIAVYADWLAEQGDPYAELIRVGLRRTEVRSKRPEADELYMEYERLSKRFRAHIEAWGYCEPYQQRNGFPHELTLTAADRLVDTDELWLVAPGLHTVDVRHVTLAAADFRRLSDSNSLSQVRHVHLGAQPAALAAFASAPRVQQLSADFRVFDPEGAYSRPADLQAAADALQRAHVGGLTRCELKEVPTALLDALGANPTFAPRQLRLDGGAVGGLLAGVLTRGGVAALELTGEWSLDASRSLAEPWVASVPRLVVSGGSVAAVRRLQDARFLATVASLTVQLLAYPDDAALRQESVQLVVRTGRQGGGQWMSLRYFSGPLLAQVAAGGGLAHTEVLSIWNAREMTPDHLQAIARGAPELKTLYTSEVALAEGVFDGVELVARNRFHLDEPAS